MIGNWYVLRFNTGQVTEESASYCLPQIEAALNNLGGLSEDGLVARQFVNSNGERGQQLSLLEKRAEYTTGEEEDLLD